MWNDLAFCTFVIKMKSPCCRANGSHVEVLIRNDQLSDEAIARNIKQI